MTGTSEHLATILADHLAADRQQITVDTTLADLGADSFDRVEISFKCEEEFGVVLPDEEFESTVTVGDLAGLIDRNRGKA